MDIVLYYIRDHLVGTHYIIYEFILFYLIFAIIGYLFKEKYAKIDIKLSNSQTKLNSEPVLGETEPKNDKNKTYNSNVVRTTVNKTSTISVNSLSNVNTVLVQQKETMISPTKKGRSSKSVLNENNSSIEPPAAKPMPNPTSALAPNPQPMPNNETNTQATPIENTPKKTDLTGTIPEL